MDLLEQRAHIVDVGCTSASGMPVGAPVDEPPRLPEEEQNGERDQQAVRAAEGDDDAPLTTAAIDAMFVEAISAIPTQPLPRQPSRRPRLSWQEVVETLLSLALILGSAAGLVWGILTYPGVTVTLVPVEQRSSLTTSLSLSLRPLPSVRLTRSATTPTSGTGRQQAEAARGLLTFYNGALVAQSVAQGTLLTGQDGVQVVLTQSVLVPAANPPLFGQASAPARAVVPGTHGNIAANDLNGPCCVPSLLVKNLEPFAGGLDARAYRAVAQRDLDTLTARLKAALFQQLPTAFALHAGEAVVLTGTTLTSSAAHRVGEEARTVAVTVTLIGHGMAYQTAVLLTQARSALRAQASPGANYRLLDASVSAKMERVAPLLVICRGLWVYTLSEAQLQALARQIAGLSPQQATVRLLHSEGIAQAIVPQALPNDPQSIHFRVMLPA